VVAHSGGVRARPRRRKTSTRVRVQRFAVGFALLAIVGSVLGLVFAGSPQRIAAGVRIDGVNVGGMTPHEAERLLQRRAQALERVPAARRALERAGRSAVAAGNISPTMLETLMQRLDDNALPHVWVLELSSFQLDTVRQFEPNAAAILNLTQDHLDWHGDMQGYGAAKARILGPRTIAVVNRDDPAVERLAEAGAGRPRAGRGGRAGQAVGGRQIAVAVRGRLQLDGGGSHEVLLPHTRIDSSVNPASEHIVPRRGASQAVAMAGRVRAGDDAVRRDRARRRRAHGVVGGVGRARVARGAAGRA
jgi:hypothetical protein